MARAYSEIVLRLEGVGASLGAAKHLLLIVLPNLRDRRLILRSFEAIHRAILRNIGLVLQFDYLRGRINLTKDSQKNLEVFFKRCALEYGLGRVEQKRVREIISLGGMHKGSGVEFPHRDKMLIFDDREGIIRIGADDVKRYLNIGEKFFVNTKLVIDDYFRKVFK